jgi:hypothetical protein
MIMRVVMADGIDDCLWPLGGSSVIEKCQAAAIYLLIQDREIGPNTIYVEALSDRVDVSYLSHI